MIMVVLLAGWTPLRAAAQETPEERDARMAWWREAKFGMFIHWGLYAVPAGVWNGKEVPSAGEWIMFTGKIPVEDYEPLITQFNPIQYDPDAWVRLAKNAGMKYIVITSKHHDGFSLFDSALSDWDVMSTPYGKDLLKPLAEACRREGLKMCWYHSVLDWHHPDYLPRGEGSPRPWDTRPTEGADYNRYIDYMKGQLHELLTNYGEIGVLWFDGGWEHPPEEHRADEVVAMIRDLQPNIIINNRIRVPQDFDTPEQYIPATGIPDRDWEVCMTMNDTWGFKVHDTNWKSTEDLIRKLIDIASKGGNFLLNVGPTPEGLIPEASIERLEAMGRWMDVNSESIYGTTASPFRRLPWGRCTKKPGVLYLHVFDWPEDGRLLVPGLQSDVRMARLLADALATALETEKTADSVVVRVPAQPIDPVATVVVLEIDGDPNVLEMPLLPEADGSVLLRAADATIHGSHARYESSHRQDNIGSWTDPKDTVRWKFRIDAAGGYKVEMVYACPDDVAGSTFSVNVGDASVAGTVEKTGSWDRFRTRKLDTLSLSAGTHELTVVPQTMPHGAVMNLQSVRLAPVQP